MSKKNTIILGFIVLIYVIYYILFQNNVFLEEYFVKRVIDGDTIVLEGDIKVRLKGINTPEKNMLYYQESTDFLKNLLENRSIKIRHYGQDKYGRYLGYIFIQNKNINELLVREGLAHIYYYEEDEYYNKLLRAEKYARRKNLGIWKKSESYDCFNLIELDYDSSNETLILENNCHKTIDVVIKDDATHIYKREMRQGYYNEKFKRIFNNDKDSLYVWGDSGLLVFHRYKN